MNRRSFMGTAFGGAVGTLAAGVPEVAEARVPRPRDAAGRRALAESIRVESDRVRRRVVEAWSASHLGETPEPEALAALEDTYAGVYAYGVVGELPIEDQASPELQPVFQESLATFGRGLLALRDRVRAFDEAAWGALDHALVDDPEALEAMVGYLESEVLAAPLPERSRGRTRLVASRARWQLKHRRPRAALGDLVARVDRLERVAREVVEGGDARALEAVQDPEQLAALRRALGDRPDALAQAPAPAGTRGPTTEVTEPRPAHGTFLTVMGALVLGVGILFGTSAIVVGASLIWCPCVGIPMMLLGGAILWGGIYFGRKLLRSGSAYRRGEPPPGVLTTYEILPGPGWQATGVVLESKYKRMRVRASGRVRLGPSGPSTRAVGRRQEPAGPDAPLPGAPRGCLVGSVGARVIQVGAHLDIPFGMLGEVLFAVNLSPAERASAGGAFLVTLVAL